MAIKISIMMMLLRIVIEPWHRVVLWAIVIVTELYSMAFLLIFLMQCSPMSFFWTRLIGTSGRCIDTKTIIGVVYGYSGITCVGDWVFPLIPCVVVWRLSMSFRERILVISILSMSAV